MSLELESEEEEFAFLRKLHQEGNSRATFLIGNFYERGHKTKQNNEEAFKFYLEAWNKGELDAVYSLGRCHELGIGTKPNILAAVDCYRQGQSRGNIDCVVALGLCYQLGKGVQLDSQKAFQCFYAAAARGSHSGIDSLAFCYEVGIGCDQDIEKAVECYKVAADSGILLAKLNLGEKYLVGMGTEQNLEKAFDCFLDCSSQGLTEDANAFLGYMYERGLGPIPSSLTKAIHYYTSAHNQFALVRFGYLLLRRAHSLWKLYLKFSTPCSNEEIFSELPREVKFHIFSYLEINELLTLTFVSRGFFSFICEFLHQLGENYLTSTVENSLFEYCTLIRWLHVSVEHGDVDAACFTALLYEKGLLTVPQDRGKAYQLFHRAFLMGNDSFASYKLDQFPEFCQ